MSQIEITIQGNQKQHNYIFLSNEASMPKHKCQHDITLFVKLAHKQGKSVSIAKAENQLRKIKHISLLKIKHC